MIVHDLKNPLNTLLAYAQLPEVRQSAQQMMHMVLNILDVQKFESAELKLHWSRVSVVELIEEALDQVKVLRQQKNLTIRHFIAQDFQVKTDRDITLRVLINLFTNAIKHSPLNTSIEIRLEEMAAYEVKLLITDEGPGVEPDLQDKVFDKFFSLEANMRGGVKSSGLGLTFCKLAVEEQGGQIGVVNESSKGASFWFTLEKNRKRKFAESPDHCQPI